MRLDLESFIERLREVEQIFASVKSLSEHSEQNKSQAFQKPLQSRRQC